MNKQKLQIVAKLRGFSGAELARRCGVSRQAVSLWFRKDEPVGLRAETLLKLSASLGVSLDSLVEEIPHLGDEQTVRKLETQFNWDKQFVSIEEFVVALLQFHPRALARLVQTIGLFEAAALFGKRIWRDFEKYKRFMHPKRREQCQEVWKIQKNLGLI